MELMFEVIGTAFLFVCSITGDIIMGGFRYVRRILKANKKDLTIILEEHPELARCDEITETENG